MSPETVTALSASGAVSSQTTSAAVLSELGGEFTIIDVAIQDPAPGEVLFDVVGVGLCHTDLAVRDGHLPFPLPGVVGHEGSGIVKSVGPGVTKFAPGDRVAASFSSCGKCDQCNEGFPSYCRFFMDYNFGGKRPDGSTTLRKGSTQLGSNFFGQSTFATQAIASERNLVKIPEGAPLELVGPLGCGIQTGAGAVMNALACEPGSSLLVTGGGSVGLAAVLGAVVREVGQIIVVEPMQQRRALALSLGATHVIDPASGSVTQQVKSIAPQGVHYALDTTANGKVLEEVVASLRHRGHLATVGVPSDPTAKLCLDLIEIQSRGLSFTGITEGNSDPNVFIPELIDLHLAGRFPFDKLITTVPFAQINEAVLMQASGDAVKVVLTLP